MLENIDVSDVVAAAGGGIATAIAWVKGRTDEWDKRQWAMAAFAGLVVAFVILALVS